MGAGHAQGPLHSNRTPADSVCYKTEWMVLEVGGLSPALKNVAAFNEKGEVNL